VLLQPYRYGRSLGLVQCRGLDQDEGLRGPAVEFAGDVAAQRQRHGDPGEQAALAVPGVAGLDRLRQRPAGVAQRQRRISPIGPALGRPQGPLTQRLVHRRPPGAVGDALQRRDLGVPGRPRSDALARLDVGQGDAVLLARLGPHDQRAALKGDQLTEDVGRAAVVQPPPDDHTVAHVTCLEHVLTPDLGTP
jgi:hypothetical protein